MSIFKPGISLEVQDKTTFIILDTFLCDLNCSRIYFNETDKYKALYVIDDCIKVNFKYIIEQICIPTDNIDNIISFEFIEFIDDVESHTDILEHLKL